MATKIKPLANDDDDWQQPVNQLTQLPVDDEPESALDRVMTMLQGTASDRAIVKLYRKIPSNPKGEWCADYTVQTFEDGGNDMIRKEWGAGTYYVWVYGPHPDSGRMGRLAYEAINIAAGAVPVTQSASSSSFENALLLIAESQRAILEAVTAKSAAPNGMDSFLDTLIKLKTAGLMGNSAPAPTPISEALAIVRELRGAASELVPDDKKSDMSQILEIAAPVVSMIRDSLAARNMGAMPEIALPQSIEVPEPVSSAQTSSAVVAAPAPTPVTVTLATLTPDQKNMYGELIAILNDLLAMSVAGKTSDEGADFLADKLPDEALDMLDLPNWFALLSTFDPRVKAHEPWIRECVKKLDEEPNILDVDPAAEGGSVAGMG